LSRINWGHSALLVDVEALTYVYRSRGSELVALRDHQLQVAAGEKVAVVGPSGSGKTTLLNILACLERPDTGRVWVAGFDMTALTETERHTYRRTIVGYVWQRAGLGLIPELTALENVQVPMVSVPGSPAERHERALQILHALRLSGYLDHLPRELGYEETQRLALAVALANQPRLLLADELTSELDLASSDRLMEDLDPLLRDVGTAAIMVTHDLELERYVDRIIPMRLARPVPETGGDARVLDEFDPAVTAIALARHPDVLVADSVTQLAPRGNPRVPIVNSASFRVRQSEFVAIAGRSGSGKSTLLRLCGGLEAPDAGRITIGGHDLATLHSSQRELLLQKHVGWVLPNAAAPQLVTAMESLALTAEIGGASSEEARRISRFALRSIGLLERGDYPLRRLSAGELQRLALARAMIKGPAVIIADEPTAQLDAVIANGILALLREVANSGVAVLLATHEPMVAEVADRILVMERGQLREARNRRW
jgi:ABC-type lipoprotein export system ATPase subunit